MPSFAKLKSRVQKINKIGVLRNQVKAIVLADDNLPDVKASEFREGMLPDGSRIGFYQNQIYANMKQRMNPKAGGTVDLMLTGDFIESFFVKSKGKSKFTFDATDEKTKKLKGKYGGEIMGLNQETFNRVQKDVYANQLLNFIAKSLK